MAADRTEWRQIVKHTLDTVTPAVTGHFGSIAEVSVRHIGSAAEVAADTSAVLIQFVFCGSIIDLVST